MYPNYQSQAQWLKKTIWKSGFTSDDFLPRFFRLASINILSNLMVPLSGLIGIAFLGHLTEIRHLAGVSLSTILFNYLYRALGFLRMSTTGITAQAVGRGDRATVLLTGMRNGILALGLGIAILLLHQPLGMLGFGLLSAAPEVKEAGLAYYDARILGAPATLLNFVLIGWFLGREQSSKVLVLSVVGNGVNILLDYLLIVSWGWESTGAGLATALSQYLMALVGIIFVCREIRAIEVRSLLGEIFAPLALKDSLTFNRDIFIRTITLLSAFSLFTNLSSLMGTTVLAENALLLQVITLSAYLIDGLAFATESLAGIFQGKGTNRKLLSLLCVAGSSSLLVGLTFAVTFVLFPENLFGLLTNHIEIVESIDRYVLLLLPVLGFGSIAFMLDGYFAGLAEGKTLRNAALISTFVIFVPIAIVAWQFHSGYLLWLAMSSFMAARVVLLGMQVPRTILIPIK
jgi:MATE family multidrug resistance protein